MMILFKIIVLCALGSSQVFASAIKPNLGRLDETKGGLSRSSADEQQQKLTADSEPLAATKGAAKPQLPPIKQELDLPAAPTKVQQERVESAREHFEARPQVELVKQVEQQREAAQTGQTRESDEQQREELFDGSRGKLEQQEEEKGEQLEFGGQQIEVEQRRFGESAFIQPILPLTVVEETRQQQLSTKGKTVAVKAPEAEPYAFSYQVEGSSRSESGDTKGVVRGQYTLQGADGSSRVVDYIADENGFRASVNTNEFGTEPRSPANIALRSSQPFAQDISLKLEGKTREDLSVKGAPAPAKPDNWSVKSSQAPIYKAEESAKGERLSQVAAELEQQLPIKSAELTREPKSSNFGEPKQASTNSGRVFESATAHREYRPTPPSSQVRTRVVRPQPPAAVRAPPQSVSRAYLQRERYPPSPVQGYRRQQQQAPGNPRVSFYSSSAGFDEERPLAFEQPAELS